MSDRLAGMRVSAKSDYAVRALIELTQAASDRPVSAETLGERQDIPPGFLKTILADLRRAGVVRAQRGQAGGWLLGAPAGDVSVADVIRAVDGPLVSVAGLRPEVVEYQATASGLQDVWIATRGALRDVLENVTIADLADGSLPREVTSRTADEEAWQPH